LSCNLLLYSWSPYYIRGYFYVKKTLIKLKSAYNILQTAKQHLDTICKKNYLLAKAFRFSHGRFSKQKPFTSKSLSFQPQEVFKTKIIYQQCLAFQPRKVLKTKISFTSKSLAFQPRKVLKTKIIHQQKPCVSATKGSQNKNIIHQQKPCVSATKGFQKKPQIGAFFIFCELLSFANYEFIQYFVNQTVIQFNN